MSDLPFFLRDLEARPAPAPAPLRAQVDAWEDGATLTLLVAVQAEARARAWVVRHDAATESWTGGCANLSPCRGHHDRHAAATRIPKWHMTGADMALLWAGPGGNGLGAVAEEFLREAGKPKVRAPGVAGTNTRFRPISSLWQAQRVNGVLAFVEPQILAFPPQGAGALDLRNDASVIRADGRGRVPSGAVSLVRGENPAFPEGARSFRLRGAIHFPGLVAFRELLVEALARMAARRRPDVESILPPEIWTAQAHAFYACQGRAGARRRQAGKLYPALATALANVDGLAELIDRGRPYDDALRDVLERALGEAPAPAVLRRMRSFPPGTDVHALRDAVKAANRLPPDWLPVTPAGWAALSGVAGPLVAHCDDLGVRLADIAGPDRGRWLGTDGGEPPPVDRERVMDDAEMLMGAQDMARRLGETLLAPLARSLGDSLLRSSAERIAGTILFEGKSLPAVDRLQEAWHGRLDRFNADLPAPEDNHSWPAAFQPFRASNGLEVACLTDEAQLRAEGGEGPDDDGLPGLDHCVGGYGRRCFSGETHVASIRRRTPDGAVRSSTVELCRPDHGPGPSGVPAPPLVARQHRGPSNGPPSPDDEAALEELLSALATGAHPIDGKAIAPRDGDGYGDAYDWRRPGAVERAFAAWAPFLPKGIVGDGLAGLAAEMRSQSEAPFVGHAQGIRRNGNAAAPRPGSGGGPARVMLDEFHFVEQHNAAAERRRSEAEDMLGGAQGPRMVG